MFESLIPTKAKPYKFAKGEVSESPNEYFPWHESMYRIKQKSVVLLTNYFKTPAELNNMMRRT